MDAITVWQLAYGGLLVGCAGLIGVFAWAVWNSDRRRK